MQNQRQTLQTGAAAPHGSASSPCAKAESNVPFYLHNFQTKRGVSASLARQRADVSANRMGKFVKQRSQHAIAIQAE